MPALRFAPEAQGLFDEWRADLEAELRGAALAAAPSYAAHLAKYRSLFPSLALLFHLVNVAAGRAEGPVSDAAAEGALAWIEYLKLHARKLYSADLSNHRLTANQPRELPSQ